MLDTLKLRIYQGQQFIKDIQNKSLSILLNFIIELIQDNNCLTIYHILEY